MDALLGPVKDALGGGAGTLWMVGGGLVAMWLALKIAKMVTRIVVLGIGLAMVLSAAPWASNEVDTPAADCVRQAVEEAMTTVESLVAKRVTVDEVSGDAVCRPDGIGLATGSGKARLRSFYDVPIQEYAVTPEGATARFDTSSLPGSGSTPDAG